MKTILTLLLALLALSCCAPRAASPGAHVRQAVPEQTPDSADAASRVRDAAGAVDRSAAGIEQRAGVISRETRSLREALNATTAEADRMRKLAATTKEEMNELWMRLTDITRRSLLLEDQAAAAVKALDEQRELRRLATDQITAMEIAARNKDAEAEMLRMQFQDEAGRSLANHQLAEENAAAARKAATAADNLRGQRKVWIALTVTAGAIAAALAFLNYGLPALRRGVTGL